MSRQDKLLDKLNRNPPPKDFRFEEMVVLLERLGFEMNEVSGGSSHKYFVRQCPDGGECRLNTSRPHPNGIMKAYQIKEIRERLADWGLL